MSSETKISDGVERAKRIETAFAQWGAAVVGKVVVVTGSARGIGRTMAEALLEAGAKVVAIDKSWAGADSFREMLEANGGLAQEADISKDADVDAAFAATIDRFKTVDVLINNAALVSETMFAPKGRVKTLETTDQDWERMFGVNVFGTLKVIRRFIKPMLEKHQGSIINVLSTGILTASTGGGYYAERPWTVEMPYQATKGALSALNFYLAEEVKSEGVAVNAIMPGHTRASWFDSTARAFQAGGIPYFVRPVVSEHLVPITLFLSTQDGRGVGGRLYSAPEWNYDHGFGDYSAWLDHDLPKDMEAVYSKVEGVVPPYERSGVAWLSPDVHGALFSAALGQLAGKI
jgi:NAD(P)-dependent dehydrogenase (short-subunit alcohol dehydrogenase family)